MVMSINMVLLVVVVHLQSKIADLRKISTTFFVEGRPCSLGHSSRSFLSFLFF